MRKTVRDGIWSEDIERFIDQQQDFNLIAQNVFQQLLEKEIRGAMIDFGW